VVVAGAVAAGLTFLMPPWFRATATLLPPEDSDPLAGVMPMQRFLSRIPSVTGLNNYYTPSDLYTAILASRSVQQPVVERFDLKKVYRQASTEKALKELRRHAKIGLAPDGTIAIAVEDRSADRAAAIANALVEELDRFNVERRNFQAKRSRVFLERRVAEMDSMLKITDGALRSYQERHHVVAPPEAESATLGPLADLMARKMALEVRLSILRSYLREDNEQVVQTRIELDQLKAQLGGLPQVESELGRLARDARLYQQVYVLLSAQLEDARMRETMDTPTVTVLDAAVPPERKARPVRSLWVAGAMFAAFITSVLWFERPRRLESRESGSST
jgi:uncharacterized protein involved in exopolysaccharide biosynthesis